MKKRLLTATLVIALSFTTLLACSSKEKDTETAAPKKETAESGNDTKKEEALPESTKVILNEVAHSIFYAPMYVAIEEKYFADEGIELELVTGFGTI